MLHEDIKGRQINIMGRTTTLLLLLLGQTCSALEVTVSPSQVGIVQSDVLLSCTFKVDNPPINPQFLATFWHFAEKEIARHDSKATWSAPRFTINEQAIKQGNASLTIHNVTVSDQGAYKCTVVYSPNSQEQIIQLDILAVPEVSIQKKAIQSGMKSLLQCSITNFFPKDMKVTWLKNGQILSGSVTQDDSTNADNTFTRISSVNVTFLEEQGNPKITCQVEHKYLQDPIKDFYTVQYGDAILDVSVEPKIVAKTGAPVHLKCLLLGIKEPLVMKDFMIQWYTRGKQIAEYDDKINIEKPGLSLSLEALKKGDATLTIQSFDPVEHAGNFRCYVYYKTEHSMKQTVLAANETVTEKESEVELSTCETVLDRKLDKIIDWISKVEGKLAEVTRTCSTGQGKARGN